MDLVRMAGGDQWEQFVSTSLYALALEAAPSGFSATARLADLGGGLRIADLASSGMTALRRTSRLVSASPSDDLLFLVQLSGSARVEQDGQQMELTAGHAAFCDPTVAYTVRTSGSRQLVSVVPRREVLAAQTRSRDIRLRPMSMTLAPLRVFQHLAREVTADGAQDPLLGVTGAASELLRGAASLAGSVRVDPRSWTNETRRRVVEDYLLRRLSDPTVTMDSVAAACGVSPRYLRALFEPEDSPAAYLRRERLRRARRDLSDPQSRQHSIAAVAARWGFADSSTFGRAYRKLYGERPMDTRIRAQQP